MLTTHVVSQGLAEELKEAGWTDGKPPSPVSGWSTGPVEHKNPYSKKPTIMKELLMRACERIMAYLDPVRLHKINISTEEIKFSLKGHIIPGKVVNIKYVFGASLLLDRDVRIGKPMKPGYHDFWISDCTLVVDGVERGSRLERICRADMLEKELVSFTLPKS